ncbi:MAG: hypothetical protein GX201_04355 [Clostridiales bacterium]|nr:hypothetical protein [Clostridiales bacterium]
MTNYDKLVAALEKIESLKEQEEDKKKAAKVEDAIDKLPKVENLSLDDKEAVEDAREAYDNLTNQQKALVKNLAKLEAAENKIKAAKVEKIIDDLPYIEDLTLEHKEAVENARAAYEALTEAQKALVNNLNKLLVNNLNKLKEAEDKIKELEDKIKEEERKAHEEEARRAAEEVALEAVEDFEANVSDEAWDEKISALTKAIDDLKNSMNLFFQEEEKQDEEKVEKTTGSIVIIEGGKGKEEKRINLEKALEAANKAAEEAEKLVRNALEFEESAMEAYSKLHEGDVKTALAVRINAAKAKVYEASQRIEDLKGTIPTLQDVLDVKAAKTWLTADKFTFDPENSAESESPIIYAALKHENQTAYKYTVVENNKAESSKNINIFRMSNKRPGSVKIEERRMLLNIGKGQRLNKEQEDKDAQDKIILRVNRGNENSSVMIKVEVTKGNAVAEKYFKINIPKLDTELLPVTIEKAEPPKTVAQS